MTYDLYIGDQTFSSWSLRGWLMLECFDLPFQTHLLGLYTGTLQADLAPLAPARTVPVLRTPEGHVLTDTLSIAETLAERHPDRGYWPSDPAARALARNMVAEMHSGFGALRGECPMILQWTWPSFPASDAVRADVARIQDLWHLARDRHGAAGPWLFGEYSLVDAFYAPVAARFATYGLADTDLARDYVASHLSQPAFRRWRAMGAARSYDPFPYPQPDHPGDWLGPPPRAAALRSEGPAINDTCPFSGKPVTHFVEVDDVVIGLCNAESQRRVAYDAEAWPAVAALLQKR